MDKLAISDGVLPNATVNFPQCFSLISFDPCLLETLFYYIVLFSISSSICLLSSLVLEFLSPFSQPFDFLGVKVFAVFRGLLHINAARKAAVVHLMRR